LALVLGISGAHLRTCQIAQTSITWQGNSQANQGHSKNIALRLIFEFVFSSDYAFPKLIQGNGFGPK
jgi:hypothetical protein